MSGSQAAEGMASPTARSVQPPWDQPRDSGGPSSGPPGLFKGVLTFSAATDFLRRNGRQIATLAALLFIAGLAVTMLIPARYAATALVVVDPREPRVTNDPDVLSGIGQDAAALQSLIEIAKSDGFLRPLVQQLKVGEDSEIADGETDPSRVLERFRKRLDISRRGLTYVIGMTFVSNSPERAARYANAIAQAFVASQSQVRTDAADEAAGWLNSRLKTLSDRLRVSEDAVAAFKAEHRIVNAGRESTTRQLRVTELSQQVSTARLRAEEAKNRYEQAQRDLKANIDSPSSARSELLGILRAQRTQLNDQIAQKRAVLGDRHPDLVIANNQLTELNRQIETERRRNIDSARSDYETVRDQQKSLEQALKALEGEMLLDGQAAVKLQELQREAEANKNIYEQFLSRFNSTNEQRLLQASQTKIASIATPPTRPTRPPLPLIIVALALLSVLASVAIIALRELMRARAPAAAAPVVPEPQPDPTGTRSDLDLPIWSQIPGIAWPNHSARRAAPAGAAPDLRGHLGPLLDGLAVKRGQRGKVVLLTSAEAGTGKTAVARSLNALAIERGLLSVLIQVSAESVPVQVPDDSPGAVRSLKTTVRSLNQLLGGEANGPSPAADVRSEFDLIVVDAPALAAQPDAASLAAQSDVSILIAKDGETSPAEIGEAAASLARLGNSRIGLVINGTPPTEAALADPAMAKRAS